MSKYCIECGNKLPDDAKFCNQCGKQQDVTEKNIENKPIEMPQESTGPDALDLKAAINLIFEVKDYIQNVEEINMWELKNMEKKIVTAEKIIKKAQSNDPTIKVLIPGTKELTNCERALAFNDYTGGRLGFDVECSINKGRAGNVFCFKKAQKNFKASLDRFPDPEVALYYALAKHEEFFAQISTTITPHSRLKKSVKEAYQYVIDTWPDSEWAVEARKYQASLQ